jgi:hypothetical protein
VSEIVHKATQIHPRNQRTVPAPRNRANHPGIGQRDLQDTRSGALPFLFFGYFRETPTAS